MNGERATTHGTRNSRKRQGARADKKMDRCGKKDDESWNKWGEGTSRGMAAVETTPGGRAGCDAGCGGQRGPKIDESMQFPPHKTPQPTNPRHALKFCVALFFIFGQPLFRYAGEIQGDANAYYTYAYLRGLGRGCDRDVEAAAEVRASKFPVPFTVPNRRFPEPRAGETGRRGDGETGRRGA